MEQHKEVNGSLPFRRNANPNPKP